MRYWRELLLVVLAGCVVVLLAMSSRREEAAPPQVESTAQADSMRMARSFDSLGYVIFDLSNELHSRTAGVVLTEALPPRPTPEGQVWQPVPIVPRVPLPTPAQLTEAARGVRPNAGAGLVVTFQGQDVRSSGAEEWFRANGFELRPGVPLGRKASNSLSYGDSVPWELVRLTAVQLAGKGIALRRVRRSSEPAPRVIRLENLAHLDDVTPLSTEQLLRLAPARRTAERVRARAEPPPLD